MNPYIVIPFLFALGACVGSFLNVVIWRLPRGESLVYPPSKCPKCGKKLAWYDNLPIVGWIKLGGKCRYCAQPISKRYPIIELITALLFVLYYVAFYFWQIGPVASLEAPGVLNFAEDWPIYFLYMALISALLAASMIDAELFIIPIEIPWFMAIVGLIVHTIVDHPHLPGNVMIGPMGMSIASGAAVGLAISIALLYLKILPMSFPKGEPLLDVDREALLEEIAKAKREGRPHEFEGQVPPPYTRSEIRFEIGREMIFLMPPLLLGALGIFLYATVPAVHGLWERAGQYHWLSAMLGSLLGAMVGGFVVWLTRILGTLGFGRVAMGLGDVHLMFGVGAVIGGGGATIAFFLAPFFGILVAVWAIITRKSREVPYGPYLSLATAVVMLLYVRFADHVAPGVNGLIIMIHQLLT